MMNVDWTKSPKEAQYYCPATGLVHAAWFYKEDGLYYTMLALKERQNGLKRVIKKIAKSGNGLLGVRNDFLPDFTYNPRYFRCDFSCQN